MLNIWFWIMYCCIPIPTTDSNTSMCMIWVTLNMQSATEECHEPSGKCQGISRCLESGHPGCNVMCVCSNWFQCWNGPVQKPQVSGLGPRRSDQHPAVLALLLLQHRRHHLRRRQHGSRPHWYIEAGTGLHAGGMRNRAATAITCRDISMTLSDP